MTEKSISKKTAGNPETKKTDNSSIDTELHSVLKDIKQDRENRDKQISSLIQEVRDSFTSINEYSSKRDELHDKEFRQLISTLSDSFTKIEKETNARESRNESIIASLSDSILKDHQNTQQFVDDQGKLQDKKLKTLDQLQQAQIKKTRLIAIPGIAIALLATVYIFYTVHVMETAMTSMSKDMQQMKSSMSTMSHGYTAYVYNMGFMTRDIGNMSHTVSPTMHGMRQLMPWSP